MLFIGEEGDNNNLDGVPLSPRVGWPSSPAEDANGGVSRSFFLESLYKVPAGIRKTPSSVLIPYEEGGVSPTDGILGNIINTVNTTRDITYVIWSEG
ncbi:protein phosphatase type 1 complex subunit Hex2/Reg1 [Fusarium oxysporum f. sp. phaseoli]